MKTIYKYPIGGDNRVVEVRLPVGAHILHGNHQAGMLWIWAEVDSSVKETTLRKFIFCGTGLNLPDKTSYINTFLIESQRLVFHVYEVNQ